MTDSYSENPVLHTLISRTGLRATIMDWGATVTSLMVPAGDGTCREVLLGVRDPAQWHTQSCYFNATIGRYANRIAGSAFRLGGAEYKLQSGAEHCLHGGTDGFDKRRFKILEKSESAITLCLHSPDGDMGFPGNFDLTVNYTVTDDGLIIHYLGKCDKPCYACITNHAYFNLNGRNSSVLGHRLWLDAEEFLPCDACSIPTGERRRVAGTAFDFTMAKPIGQDFMQDLQMELALGYDHPYLIAGDLQKPFATVTSDDGRLSMSCYTDYPAVQFYSGNYIHANGSSIPARDDSAIYQNQSGLCLEPEYYPDAPHLKEFADLNPPVTPTSPLDRTICWVFKA